MYFDLIKKIQLKKEVERVLHVKGNFRGGILEMAVVLDASLDLDVQKEITRELAEILKTTDEVFKNVRLNVIYAVNNRQMDNTVTSLSVLQLGKYFDDKQSVNEEKTMDAVLKHLKKFQARSKLVIVITQNDLPVRDPKRVKDALNPFLKSKIIFINAANQDKLRIYNGVELNMEMIQNV